jgi:hypothetical protein
MNSVQVKKIANGYIVTSYGSAPPAGQTDTYCSDLAAVNAVLATIFEPTP